MAERIVHLALAAYPRAVRARFGAEIAQVVGERLRACRSGRGRLAAAGLLAREALALLVTGLRLRGRALRAPRPVRPRKTPQRKGDHPMGVLLHDLRHAVRDFVRRPGFTAVAVGALALGIAANVAMFSVFHAVVLRPLPFAEPGRLVSVWEQNPERDWYQAQVAPANYLDWRDQAKSFSGLAAYADWLEEKNVVIEGQPEVLRAGEVTGDYFRVLGVSPLHGPGFEPGQTWDTGGRVAILSYGLWQRLYGGDPGAVGEDIELADVPHRIVGVMPAGFDYPFRDADLWVNLAWPPEKREEVGFRRAHWLRVIGRLQGGVTLAQAEAELATIASRLEAEYPETNTAMGTGVTPLHEWIVGDTRQPLRLLMAAVGLVLLIACANVANMLLARGARRRHEMAVRRALGGSRRRLVVQGLTEGLLLASAGGVLGLALGAAAIRPFLALGPKALPRLEEVAVDPALVAYTFGITMLTGLVFGLLPAWRSASVDPAEGWAPDGRRPLAAPRPLRAHNLLVAAEVALALPLLIGAGLVVRTLWSLSEVAPGFRSEDVLVARVALPATRYPEDEQVAAFYRELIGSVRALPGVEAAAMSSRLPFVNQRWSSDFTAEGWPADRFGIGVRHDEISPGLFRTLGVPILRGRDFDGRDRLETPGAVIVNQALAERYFPGEDPVGQRIAFDREATEGSYWRTIVGVVGDVRRQSLALEEEPSVYAPVLQDTTRSVYLQVRTAGDPGAMLEAMRARVHDLDPTMPLFDVTTLEAELASSTARETFLLSLLGAFAAIALLLAGVGIFGVTHYATTRRVREIGVRVAVGARLGSVAGMILRSGLYPVFAGIAVGLVLSALVARSLSALLFEVTPFDLATYAAAAGLLALAGLVACVPPARWARRVDVVTALRSE